MVPTANVLQRTFQFLFCGSQGTCFTIDLENRQYIVTAKHLVESITDYASLDIKYEETWKKLEVNLVEHCTGDVDISVLHAEMQLSPTLPLPASCDGLTLGQDLYFLGFPYGMASEVGEINRNFPLPLVKKATLSALQSESQPFLLDGHNNPGFSGGPVVFSHTENKSGGFSVAAVISGYQWEVTPVYMRDEKTPLEYKSNTGIIIAYPVEHAVDLIGQNPIGFKIPGAAIS